MISKRQKVKFLRPHRAFAYNTGDLAMLTSEHIERLDKDYKAEISDSGIFLDIHIQKVDNGPYYKILPFDYMEQKPEQKVITDSDLVKVRWIKVHFSWAYNSGDICKIPIEAAIKLLEGDFIEVLPTDYMEPVLEEVAITESSLIEVKFLKPCQGYAYFPGQTGKIHPDHVNQFFKDGCIEIIGKADERKKSILNSLKECLKKK
jgi:hypothetical protein